MAFSFSTLKSTFIVLTLISSLLFFFLNPPELSPHHNHHHRILFSTTTTCSDDLCLFPNHPLISLFLLCLLSLFLFYLLLTTASLHFSPITTLLSSLLRLSPSMAAVTLLALGNGSPDVFSSLLSLRSGQYRTGFAAILSAGAFVSAFVVGFVAIHAAPFAVDPACFIRDVGFYLVAALFLFYVYLSGEIFLWQAVGFVGFYGFFVGVVFWMDLGLGRKETKSRRTEMDVDSLEDVENLEERFGEDNGEGRGVSGLYGKISKTWEVPVTVLLKLTIPAADPSEWNHFYSTANIVLCPLLLLYACNSFMPFDHPVSFLLTGTHIPLWFIVFLASSSLGLLYFIVEIEPPKTEQLPVVIIAFIMSVFWISTAAGELLSCLAAIGSILELPPAILGLTVLAWGNSIGDLVADVALAKAGHPTMAMAGCFAGPMFNMLVGLGSALVIQTANIYPKAYELRFHTGIVIAFIFLLLSLMGSLLVVTWSRFRVPRFWGFCLVGLYVMFTGVSLLIAMFSG